jgi:hypothetical protein
MCATAIGMGFIRSTKELPYAILVCFLSYTVLFLTLIRTKQYARIIFGWIMRGNTAMIFIKVGAILFLINLPMVTLIASIHLGVADELAIILLVPSLVLAIILLATMAPLIGIIAACALYIPAIVVLMGIFRILEVLTARVVESEKGPVLAVVALLTALGAIFKVAAG